MQINHTMFTDREAMVLRESLGWPLEQLSHNLDHALSTSYMVGAHVNRDEVLQTLDKFWRALPKNYEHK